MSNLESLKQYLIGSKTSFLVNENNNGKTVMLSGAWGSGKTHFWQNEIEPELKNYLYPNEKACVYVSLYGKDNIESLKNEILYKAYASIKEENIVTQRAISSFGLIGGVISSVSLWGLKIDNKKINGSVEDFFNSKKINEAKLFLTDGGLICIDDFERKSKKIDLNDLFGFISQLSTDMNCKVVLILNSDVFEGEEAVKFREVKEKSINKFLYFEPTHKELFDSIFKYNEQYKVLEDNRVDIFKAIIESKELNARIYIQVLDNCLEWITKGYDSDFFRTLVLVTINFTKNHFVFDYERLNGNKKLYKVLEQYYKGDALFELSNYFILIVPQHISAMQNDDFLEYLSGDRRVIPTTKCPPSEFLHSMHQYISQRKEDKNGKVKSDDYYQRIGNVFDKNKGVFYALYYYAYILDIERNVDIDTFTLINKFVKNGVLKSSQT